MNNQTIRAARGFTLIEVSVVLVIAAIVLSMTLIRFSSFSERAAARGAAQTFAADLRQARSSSLRARTPVRVLFVEDSAVYRMITETGDTLVARYFDDRGEFRLDSLDLDIRGDTVQFQAEGAMDFDALRLTTGSAIFYAGGVSYLVSFNATGSSTVTLR